MLQISSFFGGRLHQKAVSILIKQLPSPGNADFNQFRDYTDL